jgi:hypothetical protein
MLPAGISTLCHLSNKKLDFSQLFNIAQGRWSIRAK